MAASAIITNTSATFALTTQTAITNQASAELNFAYGYCKVTANQTLTVTHVNAVAGRSMLVECVNWGAYTVNLPTKLTEGGIAIAFTSSGTDLLQIFYNGTSYIYMLVAQDVK